MSQMLRLKQEALYLRDCNRLLKSCILQFKQNELLLDSSAVSKPWSGRNLFCIVISFIPNNELGGLLIILFFYDYLKRKKRTFSDGWRVSSQCLTVQNSFELYDVHVAGFWFFFCRLKYEIHCGYFFLLNWFTINSFDTVMYNNV